MGEAGWALKNTPGKAALGVWWACHRARGMLVNMESWERPSEVPWVDATPGLRSARQTGKTLPDERVTLAKIQRS